MIKSVRIKNYKTCSDVNIILKEPLTALVGKNAVGKTNTLKGIHYASNCCLTNIGEEEKLCLKKGFSAEFELKFERKRTIRHFVYKYQVYGKGELYIKDTLWAVKDKKKKLLFKKTAKNILTLYFEKSKDEKISVPSEFTGLRYLSKIDLSDEKSSYLVKNLAEHADASSLISSDLLKVNHYGNQEQSKIIIAFKNNFEDWLEKRSYRNSDELFTFQYYDFYQSKPEDFSEYKEILKLLGLVQDIKVAEFKTPADETHSDALIYIAFMINEKNLQFEFLSDGTKRMIRLLFRFFYEKTSLLLIEEPENSVHWGLLATFLSVLDQYADDKKILFSTHSEQVLNQLKPEQLIYMDNIEGNTEAKYLTGRSLKKAKNFLADVGSLGEYAISGGLEEDIDG